MTDASSPSPRLSASTVRTLSATDIGVEVDVPPAPRLPTTSDAETPSDAELVADPWADVDRLPVDDPTLERTLDLLDGFSGIIFVGPPGTSKSWYALRIALHLTEGVPERMRLVQFHASYQYEDFIEGYVPKHSGDGFELVEKHLLLIADHARTDSAPHVVVIDELSRGEPGRVFGEALTYIEKSKLGIPFRLASGTEVILPTNLIFLATMNPQDRGVDEVDAAFERRFAKIALDPDPVLLTDFLTKSAMNGALRDRVVAFFRAVNNMAFDNPLAALGHTYFIGVADEAGLQRLWEHQLRFLFDKAFRIDREGLRQVQALWDGVLRPVGDEPPPEPEPASGSDET